MHAVIMSGVVMHGQVLPWWSSRGLSGSAAGASWLTEVRLPC